MELIIAILIAPALGYFVQDESRARWAYLALALAVFPIQTAVVHADSPDDINPGYFILNALFLAVGLALNALGARRRDRRAIAVGR